MTDLTPAQLHDRAVSDQIHADIQLKLAQRQWEPWKALAALISAAAAFMAAGAGIFALGQHFAR